MRILWASGAPWAKKSSGFANQTSKILPCLASLGHEIGLFAWHGLEGGAMQTVLEGGYPLTIFPKGADRFGNDMVAIHAQAFAADVVISFVDLWVIDGAQYSAVTPWCPLFPVDCWPLPPGDAANLRTHALQPLVYSRFAERMCQAAGIEVRYVPHILEVDSFTPGSRANARADLGWPADAFMVTMVAANRNFPSRKAIPECLKAFKLFSEQHSDALLYLHMKKGDAGDVPIPQMIEQLGLTGRVAMPESYAYQMGVPIEELAQIYRASNVLLSPSYGEGLCMPILEAAACGIPSIVGDWSGMAEVCFDGYLIEPPSMFVESYGRIEQEYYLPHGGNHTIPPIGAIIQGLEWAYTTNDTPERQAARREQTLPYAADVVTRDYWRPVLEEIAGRL